MITIEEKGPHMELGSIPNTAGTGGWRFTAKEQAGGSVDGKLLRGCLWGQRRLWLNELNRIPATGRPG